ncbi:MULTISPECIES: serine acetyltransferase [unclassified Curtobacterium]|uniref:serine acetyltransferase n=1 Tax=unclassified Curtobacterium TaxID=257496 RepID=UPI000A002CBA|nr:MULTISPECIES: serine acetyltransferase [unclassified Curtobacterium]
MARGTQIDLPITKWLLQDWSVNAWNARFVLVNFRLAQYLYARAGVFGRLWAVFYRLHTSLVLSVELPPELAVGRRLRVFHPHGIVIHADAVLGSDCLLRHNVTIGAITRRNGQSTGAPVIGNGVEFGANCVVVGETTVGDNARIAALALVTSDVPGGATAAGNPAMVRERVDSKPTSS